MSENLFRIGGVYRDVGGEVTRVNGPHQGVWREDGTAWCEVLTTWGEWWGCGYRRLSDGIDPSGYRRIECDNSERHLLPGELHCVNGEWVPIEDPELVALQTRPQHVEASCEEEKPASKPPTLDKLESGADLDGKRAPLPYFTEAKRFDPFSDFIIHHREEVSVNAKAFAGLSLDAPEQFRAPRSI